MNGLRITDVHAYPTSFPVDPKDSVTLGNAQPAHLFSP